VSSTAKYFGEIQRLMQRVFDEEGEAISRAAVHVADVIADDRLLHVFGTGGHSAMGAEEIFFRAGGLVPVNAMLDGGILLAHGALRSTGIERTPGYAKAVLDYYDVGQGDVLLIVNAYGVNACTIDSALEGRKRGCTTLAVTSTELQRALPADHPSRHPSGENLCDLVDTVVDCKVPMGDSLIDIPGVTQKVGASSTFLNALALNLIAIGAITALAERNIDPPIWQSANSPGGDDANAEHIRRYKHRIKKL
jgi:uncharacterized phosphosugar-binding protein